MKLREIEKAAKLINKKERIQHTIDILKAQDSYCRMSIGSAGHNATQIAVPPQSALSYLEEEVLKLDDRLRALGVEI